MCGVANNAYLHNHTKKRIIRHLMNRTDAVVAQITLIAVDLQISTMYSSYCAQAFAYAYTVSTITAKIFNACYCRFK